MSLFTQNGRSGAPPVGSIFAYMGTSSPDGWIICDGIPINNSNNKYKSLIDLGIGTSNTTTNTYTPPSFSDRFLRGSNSIISLDYRGGNSTVTLSTSNMPSHTHTITATQAAHDHTLNVGNNDYRYSAGGNETFGAGPITTTSAQPAITADASSVGGGAAFSIIPACVTVNYILKY
jgi:microcystin-dependent protein